MNINDRLTLISLMTDELSDTAGRYVRVKSKKQLDFVYGGTNVEMFDCKEAIQRRITVLREELLQLSKQL